MQGEVVLDDVVVFERPLRRWRDSRQDRGRRGSRPRRIGGFEGWQDFYGRRWCCKSYRWWRLFRMMPEKMFMSLCKWCFKHLMFLVSVSFVYISQLWSKAFFSFVNRLFRFNFRDVIIEESRRIYFKPKKMLYLNVSELSTTFRLLQRNHLEVSCSNM